MNYLTLALGIVAIIGAGVLIIATAGWVEYQSDRNRHRESQNGADQ